jgi:NAD+ synthase (glutamine-hydrolysing)
MQNFYRKLNFEQIFQLLIHDLQNFVGQSNKLSCQISQNDLSQHYSQILIGISGGLDSAITAALTFAALGPGKTHGILMPSKYSSQSSIDDGLQLCKNLQIEPKIIQINSIVQSFNQTLEQNDLLSIGYHHIENQNLQARIRANLLLYLANQQKLLILNTGNKSEILTGYFTAHGDSIGDYNLIGQLYKTEIFAFAEWINANYQKCGFPIKPIPQNIINKAPSAELAPGQTDEADLLPYELLDQILIAIYERKIKPEELKIENVNQEQIQKIFRRINFANIKNFGPLGNGIRHSNVIPKSK